MHVRAGLFIASVLLAAANMRSEPPSIAPTAVAKAPSESKALAHRVLLKGLARVGSVDQAIFRLETPNASQLVFSISPGERSHGVELLKVDWSRQTVTIRQDSKVSELALKSSGAADWAVSLREKEKDLSHSQHHTQRAKLERERDEQDAKKDRANEQ